MHSTSCPRGEGEAVLLPRRGHCGPSKVRCRPCTRTTRSTLQRRAHKPTAPSHGPARRHRHESAAVDAIDRPRRAAGSDSPMPFSSTGTNHCALYNIRGCRLGPRPAASIPAQCDLPRGAAAAGPIHVCMMPASVPGVKKPAP